MGENSNSKKVKEPSCSLVFKVLATEEGSGRQWETWPARRFELSQDPNQDPDDPELLPFVLPFQACTFTVFCDTGRPAIIECGGQATSVDAGKKCVGTCKSNKAKGWVAVQCDSWARKKKKKTGSRRPADTTSPMIFASMKMGTSIVSDFLPAGHSEGVAAEPEAKETITGSTRWRLIEGEAGIDEGLLTVVAGEAEVQSLCTGDTIRLIGPNVVSLPTCPADISGRWQGAYARRLPNKKLVPVTVSLDLRKESGALKGELKTSDGVFNIVSARQNDTGLQLEASGTIAGKERKIILNGNLTKGDIAFDGTEAGIVEKPYYLTGFVTRSYIADSGVLPAVLNQPYSFTLTALSSDDQAITFRLASGKLPPGITLDASSGTLSGTPTEPGIFNIRVAADDAAGNVFEQPLALAVKKMVITNRLLADAFNGQPYSDTLKISGGQPPYRFSGFPPKGLTLDPNTGQISGTPTSSTHEPSHFTIRDSQNNSETQAVRLSVRRTTILTSRFLPQARRGSKYNTQLRGVGNNLPIRWSISGERDITLLGLTLDPATGELSGTPIRAGAFLLSVSAVTTSSDQQTRNFTLTIK